MKTQQTVNWSSSIKTMVNINLHISSPESKTPVSDNFKIVQESQKTV